MKYAISKSEINEKPLLEFQGQIRLIRDDAEVASAVEELERESLLGFDTETRPSFRKGESYLPSLLQLCGEGDVFLFQIQLLNDLEGLFSLLADREIKKVGVAISRDVTELRELHAFKPAGFHDIGHIAEKKGFGNTGLRPLTALLLDQRISKGAQVSNWAAPELTHKQITYAATDAWVSRKLYLAIQDMPPNPELEHKER